jgi:hypothetical protein
MGFRTLPMGRSRISSKAFSLHPSRGRDTPYPVRERDRIHYTPGLFLFQAQWLDNNALSVYCDFRRPFCEERRLMVSQ